MKNVAENNMKEAVGKYVNVKKEIKVIKDKEYWSWGSKTVDIKIDLMVH